MVNNNKNKHQPFGIKDKLGYMLGDLGNNCSFIFASSFLMIFYTKVLGLSGAVVGIIFLVSRFVDAFTDVAMGRIVDTVKPAKDGRFRPWIRRMCIPVAIAATLMFLYVVKDWSYQARVIYAFVTYIIWGSICYTGINIPYGSMASVISSEAGDRASLSTFRSIGATLAGLAITMLTPLFIYTVDANNNQVVIPKNFTIIAIIYGGLSILCFALCYLMSTERIQVTPKPADKTKEGGLLKALFSNRALLSIIGVSLLLLLATILSQAMNAYLFMDYFKNAKMLSIAGLVGVGTTLLVAPFASKLSKKFGKKELGSISTLFAAAVYFLLFFLRLKNVAAFLVITFIGTLGVGIFNIIIWAFVTDVIDYQEVKTKRRQDGTIYAVYSFARKLGQALAGGIGGFALTAIGYVSDAPSQTGQVAERIYSVSTLIPALAYLGVSILLFFSYPLSKKLVDQNTAELKRRHESGVY